MAWNKSRYREGHVPEKEFLKTDERQRQDKERQSTLNKLSRNWNWSVLQPKNRKPDFDGGRQRV